MSFRSVAYPEWARKDKSIVREIQKIYADCKALGKDYHVDHIVPLRGKDVSGLHLPWNLQIIPKEDNLSKGNR